jgi:hypothetical protein
MNRYDLMHQGFQDELEKIAGELQGFTRSGRRPIGVDRLLENESVSNKTPSEVFKADVEKLSAAGTGKAMKTLGLMGAGAGTYHVARKANEDRKLGRQVRLQQQY